MTLSKIFTRYCLSSERAKEILFFCSHLIENEKKKVAISLTSFKRKSENQLTRNWWTAQIILLR